MGLWARYNALLEAQPLLTKALTSLVGFTAGDVLAQKFVEDDGKPYDIMRTVRLGSFGFLLHGTTGHYFYGMLDSKMPGTKPITVATKVAIDQTVWNPIFVCLFFGYLNLMEGKSMDDYVNKIKQDLQTAVMGSWAVWVPAHTINFAFIPSSQRLLYINTIKIGYNVFLSFLGEKDLKFLLGFFCWSIVIFIYTYMTIFVIVTYKDKALKRTSGIHEEFNGY